MGNCFGKCLSFGRSITRHSTDEQDELVSDGTTSEGNIIYKIIKFKKKKRPQFIDTFWERTEDSSNYYNFNHGNPTERSEIQLQCLDAQNLLYSENIRDTSLNNHNNYNQGVSSSRASSSLDLEWEHEYGNRCNTVSRWLYLPENFSDKICNKAPNIKNNNKLNYGTKDNSEEISNQCGFFSINLTGPENLVKQTTKPNAGMQSTPKLYTRTSSRTSWSHISTPDSLEWDIDEEQQKQMKVEDDNLDHETLELLHQIEVLKNKVLDETGDLLEIKDSEGLS